MIWNVISDQWFWLGAAGFFMTLLGIIVLRARRPALAAGLALEDGWIPTGRIDFQGPTDSDPNTIGNFLLQAEETRTVHSIGGIDHHEIRWRRATLSEAKKVVMAYHAELHLTAAPLLGTKSVESPRMETQLETGAEAGAG
jgi:hypothetical protein